MTMIIFMVAMLMGISSARSQDLTVKATEFVQNYTTDAEVVLYQSVVASWNYNTNLTDENLNVMNEESVKEAEFAQTYGKRAKELFDGNLNQITDPSVVRQLESIMVLGSANLNSDDLDEYNDITARMEATYSTAEATMPDGRELSLDPDLTELMATSRDYKELKWAWKGWHEASGRAIKDDYERFVVLSNQASQADGFADTGAYWRSWYEVDDLEALTESLWKELEPLYKELHAYVRRKLYTYYGPDYVNLKGPIPSNLLGNMWAQTWGNVYDLVEPFSGKQAVDATPGMEAQGYDAKRMFETSDEFFQSLGLIEMPEEFWNYSMIEKPDDRDVVCHASAWDFYNRKDFRIKQCTVVNMEDLITVHHEMGHIEYFLQYKDQPVPFRGGANPGFHEAVGDTLALAVSTPKHLMEIGLLYEVDENYEADINYLLKQALEKIAFLPFGYMIDKWRWGVFAGDVLEDKYQSQWDDLRLMYQGIVPPVDRNDERNFDPGAKFHIPANTPYIRYFVSFVVQFQFYKSMCDVAGQTINSPLYKCDFYRSMEAGTKLADMLKLGSSEPWQTAMQQITGSPEMSVSALKEYFQPLEDWLKQQNQNNGDVIGWEEAAWRPMGYRSADGVAQFLSSFNDTAEEKYYASVLAEWTYNIDITEETQQNSEEKSQELAVFLAEQAIVAKLYEIDEVMDSTEKRLLEKISVQGTGALDEMDLAELAAVNSKMQTAYSTANVCDLSGYDGCIPLDPDLTEIMATSRDYNLLRDAWTKWRDVSGKVIRDDYSKYVELENKAAVLNNYPDMGAFWRSNYETENIEEQFEAVWQEMLPLYQQLHAYIRRKLYNKYGKDVINLQGPIPAHLFGNMWAQDWVNIYDIVEPYPGSSRPDATPGMNSQGWNATYMFQVADNFYGDMGLIKVPDAFWEETMFVRPEGREVVCHASAWDFYNRKDFRIKMCTTITQSDFVTIHHELGHIQYYLQYKEQPVTFRDGANPGFHEAVGDTLALSVGTLDHLYQLGLIDQPSDNPESDINYLMSVALDKIAFIPFGYLMDKWRWDVFSARTSAKNMNQAWWEYRVKYQGVTPPGDRSENDFDPGAKFHIPNNVPYIRYFVSYVIQFQFYEALCNAANDTGPLHKCDFGGSMAAGEKLAAMLKLGSSVTWEEALQQVTGTQKMSSAALVRYFQPLLDFLQQENEKNKETIGWPQYSWQPPTNTIQVNEGGKVTVNEPSENSANSNLPLSFSIVITFAAALAVRAVFK